MRGGILYVVCLVMPGRGSGGFGPKVQGPRSKVQGLKFRGFRCMTEVSGAGVLMGVFWHIHVACRAIGRFGASCGERFTVL